LATQSNFFAASGINASRGSAAQLQNNAFGKASLIADRSLADTNVLNATVQNQNRSRRLKRGDINRKAVFDTANTLVKFI